jgi:hypothetical protein
MNALEILRLLLYSPGSAALVTAGVAILAGRHLIDAKDQRIAGLQETYAAGLKTIQDAHVEALRAKDDRIEMLERRSPARLQEDVEAMTALLQSRSAQLQEELAQTRAEMEEDRRLSSAERAALRERLAAREEQLAGVREAVQAAHQASASLNTITRQADFQLSEEIVALIRHRLREALTPQYTATRRINAAFDMILESIGSDSDVLVEIKYVTSDRSMFNRVRDAVPRLGHACSIYHRSTGRDVLGLIVLVLSSDVESTLRSLEALRNHFHELAEAVRVPIVMIEMTETALRAGSDVAALRERLSLLLRPGIGP